MSAEEKQNEQTEQKPKRTDKTKTLLFELEYTAVNGRGALYEILKKSMKSRDKDFSTSMFSRYCIQKLPCDFVPELLAAFDIGTRSSDKFLKEIEDSMEKFWKSKTPVLNPGFKDFLKKTKELGFQHIALTSLPKNTAAKLIDNLGLDGEFIKIHSFANEGQPIAGADIWMQAVLAQDGDLGASTGLVSSSKACKAALTADLHCIVTHNEFTAFQDFGGTSEIIENLTDIDVESLIGKFYPPPAP